MHKTARPTTVSEWRVRARRHAKLGKEEERVVCFPFSKLLVRGGGGEETESRMVVGVGIKCGAMEGQGGRGVRVCLPGGRGNAARMRAWMVLRADQRLDSIERMLFLDWF